MMKETKLFYRRRNKYLLIFSVKEITRGIIESVELKGNKPQIIMSRTSETFLEKLFEQEILKYLTD
jgi:transcription antitermination factor NusA-like protein